MRSLVLVVTILISVGSVYPSHLPARVPAYSSDTCSVRPSSRLREEIRAAINSSATSRFVPPICGKNGWIKVAHINMSKSESSCPTNWTRLTTPVRGCGRNDNGHITTTTFSVNNQTYTQVCGRILAIQRGVTNGFGPTFYDSKPLQSVDGVVISHGGTSITQRRIWTFASMVSQQPSDIKASCPCAYRSRNWPNLIPQFIGTNYFCDSGNPSLSNAAGGVYYNNDILWDGAGCSHNNTCCQFNKPPWFVRDLGGPVSNDLDVTILVNGNRPTEDVIVTHLELYIW